MLLLWLGLIAVLPQQASPRAGSPAASPAPPRPSRGGLDRSMPWPDGAGPPSHIHGRETTVGAPSWSGQPRTDPREVARKQAFQGELTARHGSAAAEALLEAFDGGKFNPHSSSEDGLDGQYTGAEHALLLLPVILPYKLRSSCGTVLRSSAGCTFGSWLDGVDSMRSFELFNAVSVQVWPPTVTVEDLRSFLHTDRIPCYWPPVRV